MAPIVAVSAYHVDRVRNWPRGAHALPADYARAVLRAGATPLLVPPGVTEAAAVLARVDGLILTGGGDIAPERYGAEPAPEVEYVDSDRDDTELALIAAAWEHRTPTLAICRGIQVANVALGGTILQHLPGDTHRDGPADAPTQHPVSVAEGSRLASIVGTELEAIASLHHQAIDRAAEPLTPVAWAPDGLIEGLEAPDRWFVAVQWHPELTAAQDPVQQRLFGALVAEAAT